MLRQPKLEYLIAHSESQLIFTDRQRLPVASEVKRRCPGVKSLILCGEETREGDDHPRFQSLIAEQSGAASNAAVKPSDEAAILYTSGTTARPKGVLVTHANYIYAGETVAKAVRLSPEDRHYVVLPLFHGNAQYYSTMSTLVSGASMALMARFSASRYFDHCIAHQCTVTSLFSAPIRMLLAQELRPEHRNNRLRVVVFAQNVTEAQLQDWNNRFGAPLLQLWGMTETMGPPLMNPIDYERRNMSVGLPVMGYQVDLFDQRGQPVPVGEIGQIVVHGRAGMEPHEGLFQELRSYGQHHPRQLALVRRQRSTGR